MSGIDRATRLVEQLMVLARQEEQASTGTVDQAVSLDELARQAVADAAPFAAQREIDLGLPHADAVVVSGQAEALRILLRNLIDNAIKYTPTQGTVDVRVERRGSDGAAVLTVDDSGPGIAPEDRAVVLQRFHRATSTSATRALDQAAVQGSGLGLAIVDTIARSHGSTVELSDSPTLGGLRVTIVFQAMSE